MPVGSDWRERGEGEDMSTSATAHPNHRIISRAGAVAIALVVAVVTVVALALASTGGHSPGERSTGGRSAASGQERPLQTGDHEVQRVGRPW
jgi:hypothetical protein